jgi:hypothetical protein
MNTFPVRYPILFLVILMVLCLLVTGWDFAFVQNEDHFWSALNLSASLREKIAGAGGVTGEGELNAEAGSILEIDGEFGLPNVDSPSFNLGNVYLMGWSTETGLTVSQRCELVAIGIKDSSGNCRFDFPQRIVQHFSTRLAGPFGDGYELKKEKESDPIIVTLLKNPCRLCLAFGVPVQAARSFRLYFDGSEHSIIVDILK